MAEEIKDIIGSIREDPKNLLGSMVKCPCHGMLMRIIKVSSINSSYYEDGTWRDFLYIQLEDKSWTRFWLVED